MNADGDLILMAEIGDNNPFTNEANGAVRRACLIVCKKIDCYSAATSRCLSRLRQAML
mgnify:FL=1